VLIRPRHLQGCWSSVKKEGEEGNREEGRGGRRRGKERKGRAIATAVFRW